MIGALKGLNSAIASLAQNASVQSVSPVRQTKPTSAPESTSLKITPPPISNQVDDVTGIFGASRLDGMLSASSLSSLFLSTETSPDIAKTNEPAFTNILTENQQPKPQPQSTFETSSLIDQKPKQVLPEAMPTQSVQESQEQFALNQKTQVQEKAVEFVRPEQASPTIASVESLITVQQGGNALAFLQNQAAGLVSRLASNAYQSASKLSNVARA